MNANVEVPGFRRAVPSGCLSGWAVSQLAAGTMARADVGAAEAHAAGCARCGEAVASERALVGAAVLEPVPAALLAVGQRRAKSRWWIVWAGPLTVVGALAVALLVTSRGPVTPTEGGAGGGYTDDGTRAKGAIAIEGTLIRDGARAASDTPLGELGHMRDRDRLKLRVRNAQGQTVRVETEENGAWVSLYAGVIAGDGFVPIDLVAERGSQSVLRISVCPMVGDCLVETHRMDVD